MLPSHNKLVSLLCTRSANLFVLFLYKSFDKMLTVICKFIKIKK